MAEQKSELIKMLRGGTHGAVFSAIDQIDFKFRVNVIIEKDDSRKLSDLCQNDELINKTRDILISGKRWIMNPTCQIFRNPDTGWYKYDREILSRYIETNGTFTTQELDINSSFLEVSVPLSILITNIENIDDSIFLESPSIQIHTFMGKMKLK